MTLEYLSLVSQYRGGPSTVTSVSVHPVSFSLLLVSLFFGFCSGDRLANPLTSLSEPSVRQESKVPHGLFFVLPSPLGLSDTFLRIRFECGEEDRSGPCPKIGGEPVYVDRIGIIHKDMDEEYKN